MLEYLESMFVKISKGAFRGTVAAGDGIRSLTEVQLGCHLPEMGSPAAVNQLDQ